MVRPFGSMAAQFECVWPSCVNATEHAWTFTRVAEESFTLARDNFQTYLSQYDPILILFASVYYSAILFRVLPRAHALVVCLANISLAWNMIQRYESVGPDAIVWFGLSREFTYMPAAGLGILAAILTSLEALKLV